MSTQKDGTFSSVTPRGTLRNNDGQPIVLTIDGAETLVIPGGSFLLLADFVRQGGDLLLVGKDGTQVLIEGYFDLAEPPALATEGGAVIDADLAARLAGPLAPGQYVAAGDDIEEQPIGRVDETIGEATATRVDGTTVSLQKDSPVFQGDIIETAEEGAIAIVFIDDTTFSLGEDARMVLDELIFDPASQEGSSSFSVIQGVFVFVSGEIAANNPDEMLVKTPVATLGIRGTKVGGYAAQEGEENTIALLSEGDGEVGEVLVYNPSGQVVLDQVNETTIVSSVFLAPQDTYISTNEEIFNLVSQASKALPQELRVVDPNAGEGEEGREGRDAERDAADELEADAAAQDDELYNELAADAEAEEEAEEEVEEEEYSEEELEEDYDAEYAGDYDYYAEIAEIAPAAGEEKLEGEEELGDIDLEGDYGDVDPAAEELELYTGYVYNATFVEPTYVYTPPTIIVDPPTYEYTGLGGGETEPDPLVFTEISGGAGNDVLPWDFSVGNAINDGGDGFDTVAIAGETGVANTFSINSNGGSVDLRAGGFILDITNVEALDIVGGSGGDSVTVGNLDGTDITNDSVTFSGGEGNDVLDGTYASKRLVAIGGEGDDTLITGSADDLVDGGEGNDFLSGGLGNDYISGGSGIDTMQVTAYGGEGVSVDMDSGYVFSGGGGTDQFFSIESVIGSSYDDFFIASYNTGNFTLDGGGGNDTISLYGEASGGDNFVIDEAYGSVYIERSSFFMQVDGVEDLIVNTGGGNDSVIIGDLSGTDIDPETVTVLGGSGNDFLVASGEIPVNQTFDDDQGEPAIAGLTNGNIVVAWEEDGEPDGDYEGVFARIIDPNGAPVTDEFQVNTFFSGDQDDPKITALSDGGFVVIWESKLQDTSDNGIFGQRFDASGTEVGTEFQVNSFVTGNQDTASVAALADGGFVVTWESFNQELGGTSNSNGVFAQRFEVSGTTPTAVGSEFQVNTTTTNSQDDSAVAGLADVGYGGGFVVTSNSYGQDSSYDGVFGQVFDSDGDLVGSEFQVNTTTANDQEDSSVAALDDGGFVVVWNSANQDGDYDGVFGQRFDATGNSVGVEFQVNSETSDDQEDAEVTVLADGSFVVAWESEDQDGEYEGVFAQRFDVTGTTPTPIGGEFQVNTHVASVQNDADITALADGGFAVAWESQDTRAEIGYAYSEDISLQVFDAYGEAELNAATGALVLYGGDGNDVLVGGTADDTLSGGSDDDLARIIHAWRPI